MSTTVLVVDDMAIFRDPIAASLRLAGYETLCAADGAEALQLARDRRPNLVLLDLAMPKVDGITFLKQLRADPAVAGTPVILLTAISEKKSVLAAAELGVSDYLLKSRFTLKHLLERVQKRLGAAAAAAAPPDASSNAPPDTAAAPVPQTRAASRAPAAAAAQTPTVHDKEVVVTRLLTREECVRRAEGIVQAKSLSGVIMQVISLASSPRGDNAQLASLIARDPMLSARVLQAANSAAYASSSGIVTTIPDAIRKVGCATVRNVAAALGVFDVMPESSADGFNAIHCWQHSFAVAQLCEQLVTHRDPNQAGLAYVVGLCHDLTEIFIHSQFGAEYQQVLEMVARTGRPLDQLEREMLGMTHAEFVKTVFTCIGLPDEIRVPVETLHGPRPDRTPDPLAAALWMAESYANASMLASAPTSPVAPLAPALCRAATGLPNPPRIDAGDLRSQVMCLTAMLARLSPADEAKLLRPPFSRTPVRLWLARDPALSTFDPVETALAALAELQVHPRLPLGPELTDLQGLVVVTGPADSPGFLPSQIEHVVSERAKAGRPLPLLWLSGNASRAAAGARSHKPVQTPVPLASLAAFVAAAAAGPG